MKITKTVVNHQDERGIIRDIMTHTDVDAITLVTIAPGAVRGNHYHDRTMQYDYIIAGKALCRARNNESGEIEEATVEAGDFIIHPAGNAHAYQGIEDVTMISATHGPRQGDQYEDDTFRLAADEKLI